MKGRGREPKRPRAVAKAAVTLAGGLGWLRVTGSEP